MSLKSPYATNHPLFIPNNIVPQVDQVYLIISLLVLEP